MDRRIDAPRAWHYALDRVAALAARIGSFDRGVHVVLVREGDGPRAQLPSARADALRYGSVARAARQCCRVAQRAVCCEGGRVAEGDVGTVARLGPCDDSAFILPLVFHPECPLPARPMFSNSRIEWRWRRGR